MEGAKELLTEMNSAQQTRFDNVKSELLAVLPRLLKYARNLSVNSAEAEDLLQATSERVLSRWQQFRPGSDFDRWAFTIMHSIRNNNLRSDAVRLGHGHEDAAETLAAPESQSPERNKIHQQVFNSLEKLPDGQRQVMLLVYIEGFSYKAAAEILDIPVGTLMSRIGRARVKLAADLNPDYENLTPAGRNANASNTGNATVTGNTKVTGDRASTTLSHSDKSISSGRQAGSSLHTVFKR